MLWGEQQRNRSSIPGSDKSSSPSPKRPDRLCSILFIGTCSAFREGRGALAEIKNDRSCTSTSPHDFTASRSTYLLYLPSLTFFHIPLVPFFYHCLYGCVLCMLLFNFVNYVFLLLCLCILTVVFVYSYCYVYVFLLLCVFSSVYCFIVLFCVMFFCKCVLYYCYRVSTQLQLTNISYYIKFCAVYWGPVFLKK
jgi:hypothetical protein